MNITKKVTLQLVGLDGNAFSLMGAFQRQARREGWAQAEIDEVLHECQSGDYDHLLATLISVCDEPEDTDEDTDEEDPEDDEEDTDDDE